MEVEFLSNMRYSLYTSKAEWLNWHVKLGKFGTYFRAASRLQEHAARASALSTPALHVPPALPSPPTSNHASPPYATANSPMNASRTNTPLLLPQISSAAVSPIGSLPELNLRPTPRKRSYDEQAEEPPPKRLNTYVTQPTYQPSVTASLQLPNPQSSAYAPRLPLPALTIPPGSGPPPTQLSVPPLPPPGGRAMGMVFPSPMQYTPTSTAMSFPPMQPAVQALNNVAFQDHGSRQLSPYPVVSNTGSPVSATFSQRHSPMYYHMEHRSSPYRPVQPVHTLLVPPPSKSVNNAPRNVPYNQMQYQPLGRPFNERRVGPLPYLHHEAWPPAHQFNQWPSVTQH